MTSGSLEVETGNPSEEKKVSPLSYKRFEVGLVAAEPSEAVRSQLLEGGYDGIIAGKIKEWHAEIKKKNIIAVAHIVHKQKTDDVNPTYLRALILTPEDGQPDSSMKKMLKEYLESAEGGSLVFVDMTYGDACPVILETGGMAERMTWRQTRAFIEKFIASYVPSL